MGCHISGSYEFQGKSSVPAVQFTWKVWQGVKIKVVTFFRRWCISVIYGAIGANPSADSFSSHISLLADTFTLHDRSSPFSCKLLTGCLCTFHRGKIKLHCMHACFASCNSFRSDQVKSKHHVPARQPNHSYQTSPQTHHSHPTLKACGSVTGSQTRSSCRGTSTTPCCRCLWARRCSDNARDC